MSGKQRGGFCAYCGVPIAKGRTCTAHRDLERRDPHAELLRTPTSERELGLVVPWPEGELDGDDDEAA